MTHEVLNLRSATVLNLRSAYAKESIPVDRDRIPSPEMVLNLQHLGKIASKLMPITDWMLVCSLGMTIPEHLFHGRLYLHLGITTAPSVRILVGLLMIPSTATQATSMKLSPTGLLHGRLRHQPSHTSTSPQIHQLGSPSRVQGQRRS